MRFGAVVLIKRGSPGNLPGTPGCIREIHGILVGARGHQKRVRLLEDDPLATVEFCVKKGDVGWWSASQVSGTLGR
jgi:hypothetical protein